MNRVRIAVVSVGSFVLVLAVVLLAVREGVAVAGNTADTRINVVRTAPAGGVTLPEDMERNYRSCLFTMLPQVGSDAAAEMLRDACRDEYPVAGR